MRTLNCALHKVNAAIIFDKAFLIIRNTKNILSKLSAIFTLVLDIMNGENRFYILIKIIILIKGIEINGLDKNGVVEGAIVYHAGTKLDNGKFLTNGGRVLGVTARAETLPEALAKAYSATDKIYFEGAHKRADIGKRALDALK